MDADFIRFLGTFLALALVLGGVGSFFFDFIPWLVKRWIERKEAEKNNRAAMAALGVFSRDLP